MGHFQTGARENGQRAKNKYFGNVFEGDSFYWLLKNSLLFAKGLKFEDGCQSRLLIAARKIVRVAYQLFWDSYYRHKHAKTKSLIPSWVSMTNDNV